MQVATLTQKAQATILVKIRKVLHLQRGDKIAFDVKDDTVTIRKLESFHYEYHQHLSKTVSE